LIGRQKWWKADGQSATTVLPAASVLQRQLNLLLRFGIESGGGFVEKKDGSVLQNRARDGDPLLLTPENSIPYPPTMVSYLCGCSRINSWA